jgi:hypothetical protein
LINNNNDDNRTKKTASSIAFALSLLLITSVFVTAPYYLSPAFAQGLSSKVAICHTPPGNPDNAHTIIVGEKAVQAHLAHGDTPGSCLASEQEPPTTGQPSPTTSESPIDSSSGNIPSSELQASSSLSPTSPFSPPDSFPSTMALTLTQCFPATNGGGRGSSGMELLTCTVSGNSDISQIACNMEQRQQQQNPSSSGTTIASSTTETALCSTTNTASSTNNNDILSPPLLSLQCTIPAVQPGVASCHLRQ